MAAPKTREQLDNLLFLKDCGYEIPEALVDLVQEAEWKRRGIVEVWDCKCAKPYESQVPLREMVCRKGHSMKRIFPE